MLPISAHSQVVISGFLADPAGTDSPYEFVQFTATQPINFAETAFSVVLANNGTASPSGWRAGGNLTYGFDLTSGEIAIGETFYVGGSGRRINGSGSADASGLRWLRTIDTGSSAGDGLGTSQTNGVLGNGSANADGIAVFAGSIATLTTSSRPVDAIFFGSGIGTAKPATGGFLMPDNDRYQSSAVMGEAGNMFLFDNPAASSFVSLVGTFDANAQSWTSPRTASSVFLTSSSPLSSLTAGVTVIPEPSPLALLLAFATIGAAVRAAFTPAPRRRKPADGSARGNPEQSTH